MLAAHPLPSPTLVAVENVTQVVSGSPLVLFASPDGILGMPEDLASIVDPLVESGEVTGKLCEVMQVASGIAQFPILVIVGIGDLDDLDRTVVFNAAATAIRQLASKERECVALVVDSKMEESNQDMLVAGALAACEGQHLYQSSPPMHVPGSLHFVGLSDSQVQRGLAIGGAINLTKRLVNEPPTIMNPTEFVDRAKQMANRVKLDCEIWDEKKLEEENCRAILAVGRASTSPPRLLILRHNGGDDEAPLAIVGKGVTFDSGGLSLKPSEGMVDMKCDMAGAATVVGTMQAIAELGIKRNVIGLCGLAENMVSGDSYKLGDVIETRSGKTIEILNTDAEGRVVLSDTLNVALDHEPSGIVDLATLTGACMVALGNEVAGIMTNNQILCDEIEHAAATEAEPIWQLPMFALYDEKVKSKVADIRNIGEGRWGGAITAAKFLENFVESTPWVHIDIAGPAFADSPKPFRDAGATGVMVRSLIRWIEESQ